VPVVEVDAAESILFANSAARDLLELTRAGREAQDLPAVFAAQARPDLDEAVSQWVPAIPRSDQPAEWRVRSQPPAADGTRLVVLYRQADLREANQGLIEMLLGFRTPQRAAWPFLGRVLVIDDVALVRGVFVSLLERCGATCYAVATPAEGLRLLRSDEGIKFVVHDFEFPDADLAGSIEQIRAARPDVLLVGTSAAPNRQAFAALGVEDYVQKPWGVRELIDVLSGRVGPCAGCGLVLPLRRPRPGETPESWVCSACGSLCRAVRDDDAAPGIWQNARLADPR
jgi:CheY-like chemotaxis protein